MHEWIENLTRRTIGSHDAVMSAVAAACALPSHGCQANTRIHCSVQDPRAHFHMESATAGRAIYWERIYIGVVRGEKDWSNDG